MTITAIILSKNAATTLSKTLDSIKWVDEVILIDQESQDNTIAIAKKYQAKVISTSELSFAKRRQLGMKQAKSNWLFYLDTDETVNTKLKAEIKAVITANVPAVYRVTRRNNFLGEFMNTDQVERLFHRTLLRGWHGDVHESPIYEGEVKLLTQPLLHYTHTDITSMLQKTNAWSEIEADLRLAVNHPPVKWWRLLRIAITVWWQQLVKLGNWRFGRAGWFESYFQMIDKLIVYVKLWERQQRSKSGN